MFRLVGDASPREELVRDLGRDHGGHPYRKWAGAHWRLLSLADLGVAPGHPAARAAAEATLAWLTNPRRLREIHARRIDGRVRRCASQDGRALHACLLVGMRSDPRLDVLAESLVETQWPDGGWNCDVRPEASHSSFHESWGPITGLSSYGADEAVARGAEFLLRHRLVFSERTGDVAGSHFLRIRYPPYWHYDLLVGLRTLAATGSLRDKRSSDALDLLEGKRLRDGSWQCEGRWWQRPGSKGGGVEAADWSPLADELVTERAFAVLRAAGRN